METNNRTFMKPVPINNTLNGAIKMFREGYKIFPVYGVVDGICQCSQGVSCTSAGKHPSINNWRFFSFQSKESIHRHWQLNPASNYGVNTEGMLVIDIDERNGGYENYQQHLKQIVETTPTMCVVTGSGGNSFHLYYKTEEKFKNGIGLFKGIDIKTQGGFVVGFGCNHKSGNNYKLLFSGTRNLNKIQIANLPIQLVHMIRNQESLNSTVNLPNGSIKAALVFGASIPEGQRNSSLFTKACQLRQKGLAIEDIRPAIHSLNNTKCDPPLDSSEVERILFSVDQSYPVNPKENHLNNLRKKDDFNFVKAFDLLNEPDESPFYVVDKLLLDSGTSLFVSKAKTGKTTLLRDLAVSVARGQKFLGFDTAPGPVLYLAMEEHKKFMKSEFVKLGVIESDAIYIHAASAPTNAIEKIKPLVEQYKPKLIIVDTLHKFSKFKNGNDYAEVNTALEPILTLAREYNCHVALAHHMGKSDDRSPEDLILGSTAIHGAFDTYIFISKNSRNDRVISTEQRYGENLEQHFLKLDEQSRKLCLMTKTEETTSTLEQDIISNLQNATNGLSTADLTRDFGKRAVNIQNVLSKLVNSKKVIFTGAGKRGSPKVYSLAKNQFPHLDPNIGNSIEPETNLIEEE